MVLTRHAVSVSVHDRAPDLAHAALWALIHAAHNEHPDRITLLDTDDTSTTGDALPGLLARGLATEPQLAIRHGIAYLPRLARTVALTPPQSPYWQLASTGRGDLANLRLLPTDAPAALGPGQIRVAVRAAGLNFHDVVVALGAITDEGLGGEAAGIVIDTAADVASLRPGDAVMGLFPNNAFAPTAITDEHRVLAIPAGWSFHAAASVPVAFLTAYLALVEIGGLGAGQNVLIHAGAGGVGQAAIQIAGHLGAEVFATAHPTKHGVLEKIGVHHRRIASSRSLDFVEAFRRQTDGRGVDVVLNCLTGDYIDASLDLLGPGGRFVEIGKTDIRVPADISAAHPGVTYHPCDLGDAPPEQLQRAWTALSGWFTAGACTPLPTTSVALTHAVQAFRDMSQARHTGKIVLTPPTVLDPDGTVLITGGTGMLGVLFAEHLVTKHGARHLVLVSRSGANAAGAGALGRRLAELGAHVSITACDVADPAQLAALVHTVTAERRLTAVIHAAGILDDAVITQLTGEQLDTVLAAKADAAWHLHHLTADHDLDAFVLFSSAAAVLGSPGQANYAAANAVLDALAHHRHRHQLPATSLAWGHWHTPSAMTAHLNTHDHDRLTRALTPITDEHGLALFDAALTRQRPTLITAPLSAPGLARLARHHRLPPLLCALTATLPHAATTNADTLTAQLTGHTTEQQLLTLSALVTATTATVLAHPDPNAIDPDRPFKDLGIDSLTALELRNGLSAHTGLTLPATLVFDHPTPTAVAAHLLGQLSNTAAPTVPTAPAIGRTDEPVAVIGMACRLPGEVNSTAQLWDLVAGGGDAMEPFPGDRGWDLAGLFDPDPDTAGKTYTRYGGFVAQAAGFDAEFFGISAREAQATDPQQRLLLEVCWEALETAGIDPTSLAGTDTGVFAGTWAQPYGATDTAGAETAEGYAITGSVTSVASGRVAYLLGLQGPAITIDTACSSSLVATHLACQSLRNGESTLALAGGVTIMTTPTLFTEFARQRGLAPDGRCKAFAAAADGTGFSEGAAVLVLERLSDAHANQHPVLAVIAGSAVNQDGASNGLTAPHGPAQQRVITQAAANAAISLDQVDVVEAHGTGTTLGDPVEAGALIATYGAARTPDNPLWLGSIKSNIGHTQAAAGAAGIIKMVLALNHGVLPPTLHVDTPSPHIDWTTGTVKLLTEPLAWPANNHPKTAAVSSFGVSGTNAHLILQQAPPTPVAPAPDPPPPAEQPALLGIWPVSARTPAALRAQAARLHEHVADHPGSDLSDVAYSLATTRTHHPYRAVITVGADSEDPRRDLLEALTALSADRPHPGVVRHHQAGQTAKTVFVFPGQGAQYPRMGAQLYDRHPSFARALDECDAALRPYTGWSIRNVLHRDPAAPPLDRVDVTQPALFAVMVALAHTLAGHGITPDAVIGHSQGEIAAAHIAGALSLNDAAKIVALRSHALAHLSGTGAMASVLLPTEDLNPRLAPWSPQLSIAATNGPTHTIVSGDAVAVGQFVEACQGEGLQAGLIAAGCAGHSAQVEPLREQLLAELAGLAPGPARIPLYSTVASARSGDPLDTTTMNAQYWYANLREPVHFHDTVHELLNAGPHTFVELSPHPVLAPALTDTLAGLSGRTCSAVIPTLHRYRPDLDALGAALGRLHVNGHSPSWRSLYPHANTVGLPTYPFEHRRYWLDPAAPADAADANRLGLARAEHPLLGALTELADQDQVVLSGRLSLAAHSWLAGHRVSDCVVLPAAGYIDVVLRAGQCAGHPAIDELVLHAPLVLVKDAPTDLQITVHPVDPSGRRALTVHARTGQRLGTAWMLHASGTLSADEHVAPVSPTSPPPGVQAIDPDGFYRGLAAHGLDYGDPFRGVCGIGHDPAHPEVVYAEVELPAGTAVDGYGIHPALLDAALQPVAMLFDRAGESTTPWLPYALTGISLRATAATRLQIRLARRGADTFSLSAIDPAGAPVIDIDTLTLRQLPDTNASAPTPAGLHDGVLELAWSPLPGTGPRPAAGTPETAVVSGDPDQLPAALRTGPMHPDLATLTSAPDLAIWALTAPFDKGHDDVGDEGVMARVHALTRDTLAQLQQWLARPDTTETQLVVMTRHAVSITVHDRSPDPAHAAVWALIHTAQNEHPGRITLLDTDNSAATGDALRDVLATRAVPSRGPAAESLLAVRQGGAYVARLARTTSLIPPDGPAWQLASTSKGDLASLALVPTDAPAELGPGQIRVAVRAAGLNFRDVVVALGVVAGEGLGGEAAGIVIDTAADVASVRPGDAVMGLFPNNAFAPTAITDEHRVLAIPAGWSFHAAASVPAAFLTAYLALVEIGGLGAGQNVLIHAGAGGVGQAAIQIAGHLGAEVFATAHPTKHGVLEKIGVHHRRIASSRSLDFVEAFRRQTDGRGVDVVLNCLTGDYIDASLDLLGPGGRFVEIGKTDIRVPADISAAHPGVTYHPCDLGDAPPEQLQRAWTALSGWFTAGACTPLPTTSVALTHAVQAFRDMSQARHTGKIVLTPPTVLDPDGTVLITGGTGMLGVLFAEHLVTKHGARHLVLVSRSGANAAGAGALGRRLAELGAHVSITACDVADPAQLAALVHTVTAERRLTAVIHAAGILDDAVITQLTGEQLDTVLAAKADAAWHLHHLTADHDLDAFVLFSSAAAVLGSPGQANYAAANAVLDALAHHRHRHQLPATSLAWGHWHTPSAMTAHLNTHDHDRLTRALTPITDEHGLALFDAALTRQRPTLITAPLSAPGLARLARHHRLPPLLCALTATLPHAATTNADTLTAQLTGHTTEQQLLTLSALVTATTATVLAHPDPNAIDPDRPFKDLGIDSLTALELRNGLSAHTGLTLPATLVFDHPTPAAVAHHIHTQIAGTRADATDTDTDYVRQIEGLLASIPANRLAQANVLELLQKLTVTDTDLTAHQQKKSHLADMSLDDLINVATKRSTDG